MAIKAFSDDAFEVLTKSARNQSVKYYHTFCGSAHIFLGTLGFMKKHPEGYESIYNSLTEILHKYNLSGKDFNEAFLKFAPQGEEPAPGATLNIVTDSDYNAIMTQLKNRAIKESRSMEVIDLIKELFSDKSYALYTIFQSMFQNEADVDNLYNDIARQFKTVVETVEELDQLGLLTNLTLWVKDHPVEAIGVDSNIDQLELALNGRSIKNAILTGPAGVGKTTVVYEFVQRLNKGQIGGRLEDKIVYQLDPGLLVAGSRFRGDFEQKLTNILEIVKDHPEIILFVDEGHMLVDLGGTSDGSVSAGNILKPYISRGEVQLILATTNEEYTQYILPEKAFKRRFHEVKISEPTREETIEILKGLVPTESKFFNRSIQEELIEKVVTLSNKYTLDEANPAKSINMLELACAYALVFVENREEVNVDDVIESVKLKYDIYISEEKYKDTKDELFKELLGQDDALNQVCRNLRAVEKGLCDPTKPMFSMLFAGPTGTGKTETAKIIARKFFGSDQNLIKINMGEYSAEMDVTKLTGSAKGYVGYDDEPALIKAVREKPNSVVLFDEVEKAHKSVWKILLNILDEGEMTDNKGNKISFRNCIIIFTTNLGCTHNTGKSTGMGFVKMTNEHDTKDIMKAIENYFSPEFLGRLDDIVMYNALSKDIARLLVGRYIDYFKEVSESEVEFTDEDIETVIKESEIETRGARGLKRAVRKQYVRIEDRLEELGD